MPARRLACLPPFIVLCACGTAARDDAPAELIAVRASSAPDLDGHDGDEAWRDAQTLVIPLAGATGPHDVSLRAAVHGHVLYVVAQWEDRTEDRAHKLWTAGSDGRVSNGPEREDVVAIAFPITGDFVADMTASVECAWDVWQWKSARTDPAGFAMDKMHVHSFTEPGGKRYEARAPDGRTLYISRPEDAGTSATRSLKVGAKSSTPTPQFAAQTPSGSAADVRAKGVWNAGRWTVEFARPLRTGHSDDAEFSAGARVPFAVAVLDRAEDEDHATSDVCWLKLPWDRR